MTEIVEVIILFASLAAFALLAMRSSSLDRDGILLALTLGMAVFVLGGFWAYIVIVLFFIVAELVTHYARKGRPKHPRRSTGNIIGNGAAALLALLAGSIPGFYGGVSAALADTISSEVGLRVGGKTVLITSQREVKPGTDGGISKAGTYAAVAGALLIAMAYFLLNQNIGVAFGVLVAGLAGSMVDSYFGAVLERKGTLSNMHVNFLGSAAGVLIAHGFWLLFG